MIRSGVIGKTGRLRLCKNCGIEFARKPSELGGFCSRQCYLAHGRAGLRRTMKTFVCQGCSAEVTRWQKVIKAGKGKFCSPRCYYAWKVAHPTPHPSAIPCPVCGKDFVPYGNQRTCSMTCRLAKGNKKRQRACAHCGKTFEARQPSSSNKYCDISCMGAASRLPQREFDCLGCGKHVVLPMVRTRARKFCCRECQSGYMQGPQHPLFRGNRRGYRGKNWHRQAALARERDGGICQGCRITCVQKASVDHIVPFRLTKQYGEREGKDPNDLRNLLSLCRSCHAKKTQAEPRLLRGDVIGFLAAVRVFLPADRVESALRLWGLL
jgi:5-methylcytosine-specific restriction endonuclease McrA